MQVISTEQSQAIHKQAMMFSLGPNFKELLKHKKELSTATYQNKVTSLTTTTMKLSQVIIFTKTFSSNLNYTHKQNWGNLMNILWYKFQEKKDH